ncbi:MAG TPA: S53 family peptidase [Mycobacteriales bacterium]|nr:S53 family peptidase [Mycobacteriales bacterium]
MHMRSPGPRAFAIPAVAAALAIAGLPALGASSRTVTAATLPSVIPAWAGVAPTVGSTAPSSTVRFAVALRFREADAFTAIARQVSDPASPQFRHFLTTAQIEQRFAPTAASAAAVTTWLTSLGATVDSVSPLRSLITAHARAGTLASALHVRFADVLHDGARVRVARNEPTVPAAIRSEVLAIDGLSQTTMKPTHVTDGAGSSATPEASPPPAFVVGTPCSAYWGEKKAATLPKYYGKVLPYAPCGYTPEQLRAAYGVTGSGLTGAGATVAIIDAWASPTLEHDVNTWSSRHGLPPFAAGQLTQETLPGVDQVPEVGDPLGIVDPQGWSGEETLDVEAVHGMATGAHIIYFGALTPENVALNAAMTQLVEENEADEISNSYGSGDDQPAPDDQIIFDQNMTTAAAEGIGIQFSSGDDADEVVANGSRSADYPATSDMVTAVGGTTLVVGADDTYGGETYWGTYKSALKGDTWDSARTLSGGGGGGVSTTYAEPDYQKPVVPNSLATYGGVPAGRVVPDVSLVADSTTGMLVGQTQTNKDGSETYGEYRIGGTSVSCPLWAGLMADTFQSLGGKRIGNVNPSLYTSYRHRGAAYRDPSLGHTLAAARPDYTDTQDPTTKVVYTVRDLGNVGTLHDLPGYDDATGLGTPFLPQLVLAIANPTQDGPASLTHPAPAKKLPGTIVRLSIVTKHKKAKDEIQVPAGKSVTYKVQLVLGKGVKKGPSTAKRVVYIYVDKKRRGRAITGKGGFATFVGAPLSPGTHIVTAVFAGSKDLKTSVSHKLTVRAI